MDVLRIILTTLLSIVTLAGLTKLMGHKQLAQMDFFDYLTGITIGSMAAELATELESPWRPLLATVIFGLCAMGLGYLSRKRIRTRKYVNGTPTILMSGGRIFRENLQKSKLELSEFMVMCRQAGYFDLSAIQTAIYEYNGQLSILPTAEQRPLTPEDMAMSPEASFIFTELIMDGQVLEANLKRRGLDMTWLTQQLKDQGYDSPKEVFLALCDDKNNLTVYSGQ